MFFWGNTLKKRFPERKYLLPDNCTSTLGKKGGKKGRKKKRCVWTFVQVVHDLAREIKMEPIMFTDDKRARVRGS